MRSWLETNGIEMYSAHNEWKFVVAEISLEKKKKISINTWLKFQKMFILIN